MADQTIYEREWYLSRRNYLETLADEYGLEAETVFSMASILGPNEDFDGLITALQDIVDGQY